MALDRKVGARGLRSVLENIMTDVMYEIPSDLSIQSVEITQESVSENKPPKVVRDPSKPRTPAHNVGKPAMIE